MKGSGMHIVCSDLEGVFIPEIWIEVAEKTGIRELRLTTREIADYNVLMKRRIAILKENGLKLSDIREVIEGMEPLKGAAAMVDWLRARTQLIILSDTFIQFAGHLMEKLGQPTLFCHSLLIDADGYITGYRLRQESSKQKAVAALKQLNFRLLAVGDSYNDIEMLKAADKGVLFNPPDNVKEEFPDLEVCRSYSELKKIVRKNLELDDKGKAGA
jgi:phosphoserine/homoserine phosphotransferase